MYKSFLWSELRKWMRDPLLTFMLVYPIAFGLLGRLVLPLAAELGNFSLRMYSDIILSVLALLTPQIFGALLGFSILDDRDDNILTSVKVTPLSIHQFLSFKMAMVFVLSVLGCAFVIWFSNVAPISMRSVLAISFVASLSVPLYGLLINAFAKNKIEGFAIMKGLGITVLFPIIALFFFDRRELFFAFVPGFWPAKAISSVIRGEGLLLMTYGQYIVIGLVYAVIANLAVYRFFLERTRT